MNPRSRRLKLLMAPVVLTALTASVSNSCAQQKQDWQIVKSPDGTTYKFDSNDISRGTEGFANIVDVMVYVITGDIVHPNKLRFDCAAHHFWVSDAELRPGPTQFAQRQSIAGQIEQIACARKSSPDRSSIRAVAVT